MNSQPTLSMRMLFLRRLALKTLTLVICCILLSGACYRPWSTNYPLTHIYPIRAALQSYDLIIEATLESIAPRAPATLEESWIAPFGYAAPSQFNVTARLKVRKVFKGSPTEGATVPVLIHLPWYDQTKAGQDGCAPLILPDVFVVFAKTGNTLNRELPWGYQDNEFYVDKRLLFEPTDYAFSKEHNKTTKVKTFSLDALLSEQRSPTKPVDDALERGDTEGALTILQDICQKTQTADNCNAVIKLKEFLGRPSDIFASLRTTCDASKKGSAKNDTSAEACMTLKRISR